jgi:HAD superfamily hydrolase (TIGR01459 family)
LKKLEHLSEIYNSYDTFVIDLWGVIHDGIKLNLKAVEVIENLSKQSKKIVFLSNAPRPSIKVMEFLKNLKMDEKFLKNIVTSGEAAMKAINENRFGKLFYHLGPSRDDSIFSKVKNNKTDLENSHFILCTGLFNEHEEDLNYYRDLLKNSVSKKLICTNPDLTVHRGKKEEYCAGTIAKIFEGLGGTAIYFGKPYKEIYNICFNNDEKVLAIGDNLRTDIKGANNLNIDSIFISNGVHRSEFKDNNELENLLKKYKVGADYYQPELTW